MINLNDLRIVKYRNICILMSKICPRNSLKKTFNKKTSSLSKLNFYFTSTLFFFLHGICLQICLPKI